MSTTSEITVQAVAHELVELIAETGGEFEAFAERASVAVKPLLDLPDLLHIGLPRQGNHADQSSWLYWDGDLSMSVSHIPPNVPIPVHDHGVWQLLGLFNGSLDHKLYERVDDGSTPRHAELALLDERVLEPGDVIAMPPPPRDVHGFTATPDLYLLAVVPGDYDPIRRYFDVERKTFFERHQLSWQKSRRT